MSEADLFDALLIGWFVLAGIVFVALYLITAPYGRHVRTGWGPRLPFVVGWIAMELPAPLTFLLWFALGDRRSQLVPMVFLSMWLFHYLHRALIYPVERRGYARSIPMTVVLMGIVFNVGNAYLNGRYLFTLGPEYPSSWLSDPRFLGGLLLFVSGWAINVHSDRILLALRRRSGDGYQIPRGGLYRFVSCPNYLGEIVEWLGWALATWSIAGLSFFVWTAANLIPRAAANHRWYRDRFPDYPDARRRVIPLLY